MNLKSIELRFIAENAVLAQQKAVQRGLCRQDKEIMIDLARRLDLPESHQSLKDIIKFRPEPLNLTFDELKNNMDAHPSHEYRRF